MIDIPMQNLSKKTRSHNRLNYRVAHITNPIISLYDRLKKTNERDKRVVLMRKIIFKFVEIRLLMFEMDDIPQSILDIYDRRLKFKIESLNDYIKYNY